jgi:hypothetical protein
LELLDQKVATVPELHVAVWLSEAADLLQVEEAKAETQVTQEYLEKLVQAVAAVES